MLRTPPATFSPKRATPPPWPSLLPVFLSSLSAMTWKLFSIHQGDRSGGPRAYVPAPVGLGCGKGCESGSQENLSFSLCPAVPALEQRGQSAPPKFRSQQTSSGERWSVGWCSPVVLGADRPLQGWAPVLCTGTVPHLVLGASSAPGHLAAAPGLARRPKGRVDSTRAWARRRDGTADKDGQERA